MHIKLIQELENRLANDLPGEQAQLKMAPLHSEGYRVIRDDHKTACVMILLFPKNKEWHVCLIERTDTNPDDKHGGQLSFPGGQLDITDDSFEDCALREIHEEVGIAPESVGILGGLSPLYVFVSNFLVHPFVGFMTEYPNFIQQESEVSQIIEAPLSRFTKAKYKGAEDLHTRGIVLPQTPYYDIHGKKLWGATAMIMSELEQILEELDLEI
jgi:8-oxo-dGTP pyrophosphatase MutT (NUDIX family)